MDQFRIQPVHHTKIAIGVLTLGAAFLSVFTRIYGAPFVWIEVFEYLRERTSIILFFVNVIDPTEEKIGKLEYYFVFNILVIIFCYKILDNR